MFLPGSDTGKNFNNILDRYPVTPYLDSRESFIKWVHFIHNKINVFLGKDEISMLDALNAYNANYIPKDIKLKDEIKKKEKYLFTGIICILVIGIYYIY